MSSDGKPKLAPKTPLVPLQAVLGLDLASLPLSSGNDGGSEDDSPPLAKRRKNELDSIEREKRRKIRNRIASQNSRDKKKKQVEDLEQRIAYLERLNQKLLLENDKLREKTSFLQTQNASLQPPPQEDPSKCPPRLSSDVLLNPMRSSDFGSTLAEMVPVQSPTSEPESYPTNEGIQYMDQAITDDELDRILAIFDDPQAKDPLILRPPESTDFTIDSLFEPTGPEQGTQTGLLEPPRPTGCPKVVEGPRQEMESTKEINLDGDFYSSMSFFAPLGDLDSSMLDPLTHLDTDYLRVVSFSDSNF